MFFRLKLMFIDQQCTIALAYVSRCLDVSLSLLLTHIYSHFYFLHVFTHLEFPVARRSKYTDLWSPENLKSGNCN